MLYALCSMLFGAYPYFSTFYLALYQIDQGETSDGNSHLYNILTFDQHPDGHDPVESEGDENHTIHPSREGIARQHPGPFWSPNMDSPEGKDLGIDECTDEVGCQARNDDPGGASQNSCKGLLP